MFKKLSIAWFFMVFGVNAWLVQAQPGGNGCCDRCDCELCGDILSCYDGPFSDPANCLLGPNCGFSQPADTANQQACTTWWENSLNVNGLDRGDGAPSDCIPIDGGLGFLIAGGLGIGVMGIRRRKEELEVERD